MQDERLDDHTIQALADAVARAPADAALRGLLAASLADRGRLEEAETEYREALRLRPRDEGFVVPLARVWLRLGRLGPARLLIEDFLAEHGEAGQGRSLLARILLAEGDVQAAVRQYQAAVDADELARDTELELRLGIGAVDGELVDGRLRLGGAMDGQPSERGLERPTISFADVGGMEAVKDEIRMKTIQPLEHPELYRAYGKAAGGAILMYGPPGCGKTYLARATAGEAKATFLSVGIAEVLDMWIGASERNLHELFETARRSAPCVLFFDEVDALGADRVDLRRSAGRTVVNQFLAEVDGVERSNDGVLILAATNTPWHLDPAFRRPGRFDREVFVPPPDLPARVAILEAQLRGKPTESMDVERVASRTDGFSGADLAGVVDRAVEGRLRQAMKDGFPAPLRTGDLLDAVGRARATTAEWFATARNYVLFANQGGQYDAIREHLRL